MDTFKFTPKVNILEYIKDTDSYDLYLVLLALKGPLTNEEQIVHNQSLIDYTDELEFFNLLYKTYTAVLNQRANPQQALEYTSKIKIYGVHRVLFLGALIVIVNNKAYQILSDTFDNLEKEEGAGVTKEEMDENLPLDFFQIRLCKDIIENYTLNSLSEFFNSKYDFTKVQKQVEILSSPQEKIQLVLAIQNEYRLDISSDIIKNLYKKVGLDSFDKKCETLLTYLKQSYQLNLDKQTSANLSNETNEKPDSKEKSTARQVLIMHYMFEYLKVNGVDQTNKAEIIHFLTGKNHKNIYDLVRSPLSTKTGAFRKKDLQYVRPFFENLGLDEIVKMIDNELYSH